MRPVHNALAIAATLCAAGSLLPWAPRARVASAALAAALIVTLLVLRVRTHGDERRRRASDAADERIARIRAARARRFGRR